MNRSFPRQRSSSSLPSPNRRPDNAFENFSFPSPHLVNFALLHHIPPGYLRPVLSPERWDSGNSVRDPRETFLPSISPSDLLPKTSAGQTERDRESDRESRGFRSGWGRTGSPRSCNRRAKGAARGVPFQRRAPRRIAWGRLQQLTRH